MHGGREGGMGRFGRALHRRGLALLALGTGLSLALGLACSQQTDDGAPAGSPTSLPAAAAAGQLSARATETPKPGSTGQGPVRALRTPTGPPPRVDTTIAGVPVEDVLFDTFRGGFVRLSEASEETIEALRDRIKPIYEPKYDPVRWSYITRSDWYKALVFPKSSTWPSNSRWYTTPLAHRGQ